MFPKPSESSLIKVIYDHNMELVDVEFGTSVATYFRLQLQALAKAKQTTVGDLLTVVDALVVNATLYLQDSRLDSGARESKFLNLIRWCMRHADKATRVLDPINFYTRIYLQMRILRFASNCNWTLPDGIPSEVFEREYGPALIIEEETVEVVYPPGQQAVSYVVFGRHAKKSHGKILHTNLAQLVTSYTRGIFLSEFFREKDNTDSGFVYFTGECMRAVDNISKSSKLALYLQTKVLEYGDEQDWVWPKG